MKAQEVKEEKRLLELEYLGIMDTGKQKNYSFGVPGEIESIKVEEDQFVQEGERIAVLDKEDYYIAVEDAVWKLENAREAYEKAHDFFKRMEELIDHA